MPRRWPQRADVLLLMVALSPLLHGWAASAATVPQIFRFTNGSEPESLDPHAVSGIPEQTILQELFEGLVAYDPVDLSPVPAVAERWQIDRRGRYIFYLRRDARWQDGQPLTADDFVYSWRRALDPLTASPMAYFLYPIRNARQYNQGELPDPRQLGVRALSPHKLEVELVEPTPYFLSMLCNYVYYPVPRSAITQHGGRWILPGNLIGNGPFRLKEWKPQGHMVLEKSPSYRDAARVRLHEIRIYPIENVETALNMYNTGKLDLNGYALPPHRLPGLRGRPDFHQIPYLNMYYYRLNTTRPPLNDSRVRRALNLAMDKSIIVNKVTGGGQLPADSMVPRGIAGYQPPRLEAYNPALARELLAAAGFCVPPRPIGGCKPFPKLTILYNTRDLHRNIAQAIQQMWRTVLGIDQLSLVNKEWKVFLRDSRALQYDIAFGSWLSDYIDPYAFLEIWSRDNPNNRTGWHSPEYDALLARSHGQAPAQRHRLLAAAEELWLRELPAIPIYQYTSLYLLNPKVRGIHPNALSIHPLKEVWIEP